MNTWHFYDSASGVFVGRSYAGPLEFLGVNTPAGCTALPAEQLQGADWAAYRVDVAGRQLVPYTPPPAPAPAPALLSSSARGRRDQLLADSDWTQLGDSPIAPQAVGQWKAYRVALRNLPLQPGFPTVIAWPTTPDGVDTTPRVATPGLTAPPGPVIALPTMPAPAPPPPVFPLPPAPSLPAP